MSARPPEQRNLTPMSCPVCARCEGNGQFCVFGGPFHLSRTEPEHDETRPHGLGPERV